MKKIIRKIFNVFQENNLDKNNIKNNKNNLDNMEELGFVIEALYVSKDGKEVIEVLGENDKLDNVFDFKVLTSTTRKDFINVVYKMSETDILMNYNYFKAKEISGRKIAEMQTKRIVNLSGAKVIQNEYKNDASNEISNDINVIHKSNYESDNTGLKITHIISSDEDSKQLNIPSNQPSNLQLKQPTVEEILIERLIKKHSDKPIELSLNLLTYIDVESIINGANLIDIPNDKLMDSLFENETFINHLKGSLIKCFLDKDYEIKEIVLDNKNDKKQKGESDVFKEEVINTWNNSMIKFNTEFQKIIEDSNQRILESIFENSSSNSQEILEKLDNLWGGNFEQNDKHSINKISVIKEIEIPLESPLESPLDTPLNPPLESHINVLENKTKIEPKPYVNPEFKLVKNKRIDYSELVTRHINKS